MNKPPNKLSKAAFMKMINGEAKSEDFEEDWRHENGNYQNSCIKCGCNFIGYKRRILCKLCAENV